MFLFNMKLLEVEIFSYIAACTLFGLLHLIKSFSYLLPSDFFFNLNQFTYALTDGRLMMELCYQIKLLSI